MVRIYPFVSVIKAPLVRMGFRTNSLLQAGSAILSAALASNEVSHVTVLSRRPPFVTHEKLSTIIIPSEECPKGFDELTPAVLDKIKDHQSVIWALGISQTQVSKEDYVK